MKNLTKAFGIVGIVGASFLPMKSSCQEISIPSEQIANNFLIPFKDKGKLIYNGKKLPQISGGFVDGEVIYKEDVPYIDLNDKRDSCNMLFFSEEDTTLIFIDTKDKINLSEKISGEAKYKFDKVEYVIKIDKKSENKTILKDNLDNYSNLYRSLISLIKREDDIKNGRGHTIIKGIYIPDKK